MPPGSRRGYPRRRVQTEDFDLSESFPGVTLDIGSSAWSDGDGEGDGDGDEGTQSVSGRECPCEPCRVVPIHDGTGRQDVHKDVDGEIDEAHFPWEGLLFN